MRCPFLLCLSPLPQFNSLADGDNQDVTPEEMEAYRLKRSRGGEDPMAAFKGSSNGTGGYDLL